MRGLIFNLNDAILPVKEIRSCDNFFKWNYNKRCQGKIAVFKHKKKNNVWLPLHAHQL